ncbi:exported hypothetical protein [metagenome]|uniref:DUF4012 domain-containing protein n=1 Tax=metagenome TaxID=256318 RepID=A0A2P2C6J1_9ZZZZ
MRSLRRSTSSDRSLRPWMIVGGLFLLLVLLGLLALPFRKAPAAAESAKADLEAAKAALDTGDVEAAEASVRSARRHADVLQDAVQGIGGDVWSWTPVVGGSVRDVRRLGNALDEITSVAETGVELLPLVRGDEGTLVDDGDVDLDVLAEVTSQIDTVSSRVERARSELADVADERPLVGARLAEARDAALDQVAPVSDGLETIEPLLDVLPRILGSQADRQYLLAVLNPSELRYSGGTPLTFATLDLAGGQLTMSEPLDTETAPGVGQPRYWKKVKGNRFHRGRLNVLTSTMAPDWTVSGNELANAWRSLRGRRMSGVIVVDVVALADLVALTGPLELPSVGMVNADSLVETLVGSYDTYADPVQRKAINRALAPVFSDRLLSGGDPVKTGKTLARAADERRFAVFMRDPEEQAAFGDLGLTGALGPGDRDYLGVFTQNREPSKTDYWQRRAVRSEVSVRKDGSAHVRLTVDVHNDSPPYLQPGTDPRTGYFTRWADLSVLTMLPEDAEFTGGTVDGMTTPITRSNFYGRTYQRTSIEFAPQARHELIVEYDVPSVATVEGDGTLRYGLAMDPQGIVQPQSVEVRVRFPKGLEVTGLPAGWSSSGTRVAAFKTDALETSEVFEVTAAP